MSGTDHTDRLGLTIYSGDMARLKLARRGVLIYHLLSLDMISNEEVDETKKMFVIDS